MANLTTGHRKHNMVVAAEAWQPIDGTASAQQSFSINTTVNSTTVPSTAVGMMITANVNVSLGLHSTFNPTASQGYMLASMTPSPALLVPRHGAHTAGKSIVLWRTLTGTGRINFLFIAGRGG